MCSVARASLPSQCWVFSVYMLWTRFSKQCHDTPWQVQCFVAFQLDLKDEKHFQMTNLLVPLNLQPLKLRRDLVTVINQSLHVSTLSARFYLFTITGAPTDVTPDNLSRSQRGRLNSEVIFIYKEGNFVHNLCLITWDDFPNNINPATNNITNNHPTFCTIMRIWTNSTLFTTI